MNILALGKSKTRQKIFSLFLASSNKSYYLQEISRLLSLSAGNIRRELLSLVKIGLFEKTKTGRLIYYKINPTSPIFAMLKISNNTQHTETIVKWATASIPFEVSPDFYCPTRDIFQARLDSLVSRLEKDVGENGYLLSAIAGEIGNNSFDHNLGRWPDAPGLCFAHLSAKKIIILVDRGQGVLNTIRNILPKTKNDQEALKIAFTKIISGRSPENRGNGLKFVTRAVKSQKWSLKFESGHGHLVINRSGKMIITKKEELNPGCLAVINYDHGN